MKLIRRRVHSPFEAGFKCVATIGNFDGVHLGHQAILKEAQELARAKDLPSVVITFEPTPSEFFLREKAPFRLMGFREKFEILQDLGIDLMCVLHFNLEMASTPAENFIQTILVQGLGVQDLVVGQDFRFGKNREGDLALLQKMGKSKGFSTHLAPTVLKDNHKISSTRIRHAMDQGKMEDVVSFLGRKVK